MSDNNVTSIESSGKFRNNAILKKFNRDAGGNIILQEFDPSLLHIYEQTVDTYNGWNMGKLSVSDMDGKYFVVCSDDDVVKIDNSALSNIFCDCIQSNVSQLDGGEQNIIYRFIKKRKLDIDQGYVDFIINEAEELGIETDVPPVYLLDDFPCIGCLGDYKKDFDNIEDRKKFASCITADTKVNVTLNEFLDKYGEKEGVDAEKEVKNTSGNISDDLSVAETVIGSMSLDEKESKRDDISGNADEDISVEDDNDSIEVNDGESEHVIDDVSVQLSQQIRPLTRNPKISMEPNKHTAKEKISKAFDNAAKSDRACNLKDKIHDIVKDDDVFMGSISVEKTAFKKRIEDMCSVAGKAILAGWTMMKVRRHAGKIADAIGFLESNGLFVSNIKENLRDDAIHGQENRAADFKAEMVSNAFQRGITKHGGMSFGKEIYDAESALTFKDKCKRGFLNIGMSFKAMYATVINHKAERLDAKRDKLNDFIYKNMEEQVNQNSVEVADTKVLKKEGKSEYLDETRKNLDNVKHKGIMDELVILRDYIDSHISEMSNGDDIDIDDLASNVIRAGKHIRLQNESMMKDVVVSVLSETSAGKEAEVIMNKRLQQAKSELGISIDDSEDEILQQG